MGWSLGSFSARLPSLRAPLGGFRRLRELASGPISAAALLVAYFTAAMLYFRWQEGWSTLDCFYFVVMLLTTVGYGDVAPATPAGRLATCFFALAAVALIANVLADGLLNLLSAGPVDAIYRGLFGDIYRQGSPKLLVSSRARLRMQELLCICILAVIALTGHVLLGLNDWRDCAYFAVVTVTSIGLGDITPETPFARLATALMALIAVPIFGSTLASYVEFYRGVGHGSSSSQCLGRDLDAYELEVRLQAGRKAAREELQSKSFDAAATMWREEFLISVLVHGGISSRRELTEILDEFAMLQTSRSSSAPDLSGVDLEQTGPDKDL